jgi:sarcosine oxidase subunit alpha
MGHGPEVLPLSHSPAQARPGKCFVCLCEDVTVKDLEQAVGEGFDNIETLKRYSTVTMGPCQGKVCAQAAVEICARATGRDVNATGTTTSRPPAVPVELGVLAAGRRHPVRRTPLHHWHEAAGATWLDAGLWKRPESYGNPAAEVRAVRSAAGLIDVSTLGKIELVGPDAAELLERVYLNRWSDLKVGRVRYGAMCTEEGILFDDGVGARLGPERFYLTATTGNAEAVFQWLQLWQETWRLDVTLIAQTSGLAAVNLAGPRAREALGRLTRLDVSPGGFPYLAVREADVAGVPCRLLRVGFVGELGYEIHCPAAAAWHLWESLLGAGAGLGLRPFGVEAQRILRLEKGHPIIGQDTDALSTPLEAGLGGMVRYDKPVFHGREPLLRLRTMAPRSRLVGFRMKGSDQVPAEGCQVVERGVPVGRVTSARFSPTLGYSLGLAWLPAERAGVDHRFFIRWNGADVPARVVPLPFYDPKGERLRA